MAGLVPTVRLDAWNAVRLLSKCVTWVFSSVHENLYFACPSGHLTEQLLVSPRCEDFYSSGAYHISPPIL